MIPSKWIFSDFWLLAWKLTKLFMIFFKSRVSFPLNFASSFSVMTHNSSEVLWLKYYMLWTERAHQRTIFQTFECSNESSPNSSCHFWNHRVRAYSIFASLFRVIKDNSSVFFLAQTWHTLDKKSPSKWSFQTFEWLRENSPNSSCPIWNYKSVFL